MKYLFLLLLLSCSKPNQAPYKGWRVNEFVYGDLSYDSLGKQCITRLYKGHYYDVPVDSVHKWDGVSYVLKK